MVAAGEEDELEAAASLNASAPTPRAVPSTSRASSAREGAADASQPPTPSLQSYQALYLQQLALQRPEPEPVLPGAEDVPAELRPLFKEMQQYGLKQSVGDTLGLSAQSVQDRSAPQGGWSLLWEGAVGVSYFCRHLQCWTASQVL